MSKQAQSFPDFLTCQQTAIKAAIEKDLEKVSADDVAKLLTFEYYQETFHPVTETVEVSGNISGSFTLQNRDSWQTSTEVRTARLPAVAIRQLLFKAAKAKNDEVIAYLCQEYTGKKIPPNIPHSVLHVFPPASLRRQQAAMPFILDFDAKITVDDIEKTLWETLTSLYTANEKIPQALIDAKNRHDDIIKKQARIAQCKRLMDKLDVFKTLISDTHLPNKSSRLPTLLKGLFSQNNHKEEQQFNKAKKNAQEMLANLLEITSSMIRGEDDSLQFHESFTDLESNPSLAPFADTLQSALTETEQLAKELRVTLNASQSAAKASLPQSP